MIEPVTAIGPVSVVVFLRWSRPEYFFCLDQGIHAAGFPCPGTTFYVIDNTPEPNGTGSIKGVRALLAAHGFKFAITRDDSCRTPRPDERTDYLTDKHILHWSRFCDDLRARIDCDWVLSWEDDVTPGVPGAFAELKRAADQRPEVGAVIPACWSRMGDRHLMVYPRQDWLQLRLSERLRHPGTPGPVMTGHVGWTLFRAEALRQARPRRLHPASGRHEDALYYDMSQAGWSAWYAAGVHCRHHLSATEWVDGPAQGERP